ncbi:LamG-like jellyroll fold domain-containing protein, partial [Nanoarchaeota archaeon]
MQIIEKIKEYRIKRQRIKYLEDRIEFCKKSAEEIKINLAKIDHRWDSGIITDKHHKELVREYLQGNTLKEWQEYYDDAINEFLKELDSLGKAKTKEHIVQTKNIQKEPTPEKSIKSKFKQKLEKLKNKFRKKSSDNNTPKKNYLTFAMSMSLMWVCLLLIVVLNMPTSGFLTVDITNQTAALDMQGFIQANTSISIKLDDASVDYKIEDLLHLSTYEPVKENNTLLGYTFNKIGLTFESFELIPGRHALVINISLPNNSIIIDEEILVVVSEEYYLNQTLQKPIDNKPLELNASLPKEVYQLGETVSFKITPPEAEAMIAIMVNNSIILADNNFSADIPGDYSANILLVLGNRSERIYVDFIVVDEEYEENKEAQIPSIPADNITDSIIDNIIDNATSEQPQIIVNQSNNITNVSTNVSIIPEQNTTPIVTIPLNETQEIPNILIQGPAEVGKPVKWRRFLLKNETLKQDPKISIPEKAYGVVLAKENKIIPRAKVEIIKDTLGLQEKRKEKTVKIKESLKNNESYEIQYYTPSPKLNERSINKNKKIITVSSDLHYENVLARVNITESSQSAIKVYWVKENSKELFTDITYIDSDKNSLIDQLELLIPHLSNQTFEITIEVLNVYSYLKDGDEWTVYFNTTGTADLKITPINSSFTEFLTDNQATFNELEFMEIRCGDQDLENNLYLNSGQTKYSDLTTQDSVTTNNLFLPDYNCDNNTASIKTTALIAGYAVLEFDFNGQKAYAIDPTVNASNVTSILVNFTTTDDKTDDNITVHYTITDPNSDNTTGIINWKQDGTAIAKLLLPFDTNVSAETANAVRDYSGSGYNATLGGGTVGYMPTWVSEGYVGGAYDFDGINDYIAEDDIDISSEITIMAWVYMKNNSQDKVIVSKAGTSVSNYDFRISGTNRLPRLLYVNGGWKGFYSESATVDFNEWHHVAAVYKSGDANSRGMYIDGVEVANTFSSLTPSTLVVNNYAARIGGYWTGTTSYWNGSIDDVRIYDRILSAEEIKAIANNRSDIIVSQETNYGEVWEACVTPNDANEDGTTRCADAKVAMEPLSSKSAKFTGTLSTTGSTNVNAAGTLAYSIVYGDTEYFDYNASSSGRMIINKEGDYFFTFTLPLHTTLSNSRANPSVSVYKNGVAQNVAASRCGIIRQYGGHDDSSTHLTFFLKDLAVGDYIELKTTPEAATGTVTVNDVFTVFGRYVEDETVFFGTGTRTVAGTDVNAAESPFQWSAEVRKDTGFTHSTSSGTEQIVIDDAGVYLVTANFPLAGAITRANVKGIVKLDGAQITGGEFKQGYIRNIENNDKSSSHWSGIVETTSANQNLTITLQQEAAAGTITIGTVLGNVYIEKIQEEGTIFLGATTLTGGGTSWNPSSKTTIAFSNTLIHDSNYFTHSNSSNNHIITVSQDGDYLLTFNGAFNEATPSTADDNARATPIAEVQVNGVDVSGAIAESAYIRDSTDHTESSDTLAFPLIGLSAGDNITVTMQASTTSTGTLNDATPTILGIMYYDYAAPGIPDYTSFGGGDTTNFSNLANYSDVSGVVLHNTTNVKLNWTGTGLDISGLNFTQYVLFGNGWLDVDIPNLDTTLNSSAIIELYDLSFAETPVIYKDGTICTSSDCEFISYSADHNLSFNISHFTNYSAGSNSQLEIWDDNDVKGGSQRKTSNQQIYFYANYTNVTSGDYIDNTTDSGWCNITFNSTSDYFSMSFNMSGNELWRYNYSFSSVASYSWNVTCNASDYETRSTTDDIQLNSPPTHSKPILNSTDGTNVTTVNLRVYNQSTSDPDEETVYNKVEWYINGTVNTTMENLTTINSGNTSKSQIWYACISPSDGVATGATNCSSNLTILNSGPVPQSLILNSTDLHNYTNGTLNRYFTYYDADGDTQSENETKWYTDEVYNSTFGNFTSINSGNTSKGQSWKFGVRVNDGTVWSSWVNSSGLTIDNAPPVQDTPILNSTDGTNVTTVNLTVYNQSTADVDGNSVTNIINWYKDSTSIAVLNMPFDSDNSAGSGKTKDYSGNGNNGTLTNAVWSSEGYFGGGYEFDGNGDYIEVVDSSSLEPSEVSLGFWFKREGTATGGWHKRIVTKTYQATATSPYDSYAAVLNEGDYTVGFNIATASGYNTYWSSHVAQEGVWTHAFLTYNGTDAKLYFDGDLNFTKKIGESISYSTGPLRIASLD